MKFLFVLAQLGASSCTCQ